MRTELLLALAPLAAGCVAVGAHPVPPPPDAARTVEGAIDALYDAFGWDAGGEADWDGMRDLFADGAVFVAPIPPRFSADSAATSTGS